MGVNRFMSPVKTQYMQTYVDQFVPMPFQLMQAKANRQQKSFDTAANNWDLLKTEMDKKMLQVDQTMNNTEVTGLQNRFNDELAKANGDYSQMTNVIRNIGNEYKTWASTAEGALGLSNKAGYDANMAQFDEADTAGDVADIQRQWALRKYEQTGGALKGQGYQNITPAMNTDGLNEKVLNAYKALIPDETQRANFGYSHGDRLIFDKQSGHEFLTNEDTNAAAKGMVYSDAGWLDETQKEWEAKSGLGMLPAGETLANFRENKYNYRFAGMGDPYAYDKEKDKIAAKESSAYGKKIDKQKQHFGLKTSSRHAFGKKKFKDLTGDEVVENWQGKVESNFEDFRSGLEGVFKKQNIGAGAFNTSFEASASNAGFDINTPGGARGYLQGIQSGEIDITEDFANSNLTEQQVKDMATTAIDGMRNDEQVLLDVGETLAQQGVISPEAFATYEQNVSDTWAAQNNLLTVINDPNTSEPVLREAKSDLQKLQEYEAYLNGDSTIAPIDNTFVAGDVEFQTIDEQQLAEVRGGMMGQEGTDMLNSRLKKSDSQQVNITWENQIPIDVEGGYDEDASYDAYDFYTKELSSAKNQHLLWNSQAQLGDQTGTLSKLVTAEAKRAIADEASPYYAKDLDETVATMKTEALGNFEFGNSFNPETNNMMIKAGGKYTIDLGTGAGQIDFTEARNNLSADAYNAMSVNTFVNRAIKDPQVNSLIPGTKGVYIHTPEPDQISNESEYSTFGDGTMYAIRVKPEMMNIFRNGRDERYLVIPAQYAKSYLGKVQRINDIAKQKGGYVTIGNSKYTATEAIAKLTDDFTSNRQDNEYNIQ